MSDVKHPNLFIGDKEIELFNKINYELIENIIGQFILYYSVDVKKTKQNVYGESTQKIFKKPISIKCLVLFEEPVVTSSQFGIDTEYSIEVYFHRHTINIIKNFKPTEGDYVKFGNIFYEITSIQQPQLTYGDPLETVMTKCRCKTARPDEIAYLEHK